MESEPEFFDVVGTDENYLLHRPPVEPQPARTATALAPNGAWETAAASITHRYDTSCGCVYCEEYGHTRDLEMKYASDHPEASDV